MCGSLVDICAVAMARFYPLASFPAVVSVFRAGSHNAIAALLAGREM
jgi:hypothetical protein